MVLLAASRPKPSRRRGRKRRCARPSSPAQQRRVAQSREPPFIAMAVMTGSSKRTAVTPEARRASSALPTRTPSTCSATRLAIIRGSSQARRLRPCAATALSTSCRSRRKRLREVNRTRPAMNVAPRRKFARLGCKQSKRFGKRFERRSKLMKDDLPGNRTASASCRQRPGLHRPAQGASAATRSWTRGHGRCRKEGSTTARRRSTPPGASSGRNQRALGRTHRRNAGGSCTTTCRPNATQRWGGRYRGQRQKWFLFRFVGDEDEIDVRRPAGGEHEAEFDQWRWSASSACPTSSCRSAKVYDGGQGLRAAGAGRVSAPLTGRPIRRAARINRSTSTIGKRRPSHRLALSPEHRIDIYHSDFSTTSSKSPKTPRGTYCSTFFMRFLPSFSFFQQLIFTGSVTTINLATSLRMAEIVSRATTLLPIAA